MTSVRLPFPPSVNRLWRAVPGRGVIKSEVYRSWLAEAAWLVREQRPTAVLGSYHMTVSVDRPDRRRRDLSNLLKATEDLLVDLKIIEDDHLAASINVAWSDAPPAKPGSITVTLEPADQPTSLSTLSKADLVALIERAQGILANRFAEAA